MLMQFCSKLQQNFEHLFRKCTERRTEGIYTIYLLDKRDRRLRNNGSSTIDRQTTTARSAWYCYYLLPLRERHGTWSPDANLAGEGFGGQC